MSANTTRNDLMAHDAGDEPDQPGNAASWQPAGDRIPEGLSALLEGEFPLVPCYTMYAGLYDELGQEAFALYLLSLVDRVIQRSRMPVRTVVDVSCGTGAAAIALAGRGYRVVGVDSSEEMLSVSMRKAAAAGVEVVFVRQDMRRLQLDLEADLVISLYDSVNYILSVDELRETFRGVAAVMRPGGLFIFDVNTVHCLETEWGNQIAEERGRTSVLIHLYSYDPRSRIGTLELLGVHTTPDSVQRFREVHRERGYTYLEISEALATSGLEVAEAYSFPDLSAPDDSASRLIFVATRPGEETGERGEGGKGRRGDGGIDDVGRGPVPLTRDGPEPAGNQRPLTTRAIPGYRRPVDTEPPGHQDTKDDGGFPLPLGEAWTGHSAGPRGEGHPGGPAGTPAPTSPPVQSAHGGPAETPAPTSHDGSAGAGAHFAPRTTHYPEGQGEGPTHHSSPITHHSGDGGRP